MKDDDEITMNSKHVFDILASIQYNRFQDQKIYAG